MTSPRFINGWTSRYHVAALRFLDREAAGKAINGLRAMTSRKRAKADA